MLHRQWAFGRIATISIFGLLCAGISICAAHDMESFKELNKPGSPIQNRSEWPNGLHAFLNLPERSLGWAKSTNFGPYTAHYHYRVRDVEHLQALIIRFAEINDNRLVISFNVPADDQPEEQLRVTFSMGDDLVRKSPSLRITLPRASDLDKLGVPPSVKVYRAVLQPSDSVTIF